MIKRTRGLPPECDALPERATERVRRDEHLLRNAARRRRAEFSKLSDESIRGQTCLSFGRRGRHFLGAQLLYTRDRHLDEALDRGGRLIGCFAQEAKLFASRRNAAAYFLAPRGSAS